MRVATASARRSAGLKARRYTDLETAKRYIFMRRGDRQVMTDSVVERMVGVAADCRGFAADGDE